MEDQKIIDLYTNREERAIHETDKKYGRLCTSISMGILNDIRDSEECVSDTWLTLWNQIPPKKPNPFKAYICRIIKNLSLKRYETRDSFMLSADNAHAVHPNYQDKTDPTNRPYINEGIVLKYNASQKYTTDANSAALVKYLCKKEKIKCQVFFNRSDMLGGSTLGNILTGQVSIKAADIGLPQLSMHSTYETAGCKDLDDMITLMESFYELGKEVQI